MNVLVESVEYDPGSTIAVIVGVDEETGRPVRVGADWRPAMAIHAALMAGEDSVIADAPEWAVLS